MSSTSKQTCNWQIDKVELSRPFELRCPHCNFLYSRFWANGLEECLHAIDFIDSDSIDMPFSPTAIQWDASFVWGKCDQCSGLFLAVKLIACDGWRISTLPWLQSEPHSEQKIPKFGIRIAECSPKYLVGTWLGFHDKEYGYPVESILIGFLPLEQLPSPGFDSYLDDLFNGNDFYSVDRSTTPEGLISNLLCKSFKRLYQPFSPLPTPDFLEGNQ
jgi:hypothetical protein